MKYNVFILDNKVNFNNYAQSLTYISVIKDCGTLNYLGLLATKRGVSLS